MTKTNTRNVIIRTPNLEDAPGIANVHLNSWRETYEGLLPGEYLAGMPLTFQRRMNQWKNLIQNPPTGRRVWVAEDKTVGIVGFATIENARDVQFSDHGELGAIYLLKSYQHAGVGYDLLKSGFSYLAESGTQKAYCWILKNNPSISFCERTGGELTTFERPDKVGTANVTEFACVWRDLSAFSEKTPELSSI